MTIARSQELIRLADGTRTYREIGEMMKLSPNAVRSLGYYIRAHMGVELKVKAGSRGPLPAGAPPDRAPPKPMNAAAQRIKRGEVKIGSASLLHFVNVLPPHVATWLVDQVIDETTLSDLLRAVVVDAYYDDLEAKGGAE